MNTNDIPIFYKYLDKSTSYLEYGSGGSTYQASLRTNIKSIISVESDLQWHDKLQTLIPNKEHIVFKYCDMQTLPDTWGYPGAKSTPTDWIKYSNVICDLDKAVSNSIDLILIDGRFRVACCLKCFEHINDTCYIAFDDFLDRSYYHIVLNYYDIVEKHTRLVILKKKACDKPAKELIEKYELINK